MAMVVGSVHPFRSSAQSTRARLPLHPNQDFTRRKKSFLITCCKKTSASIRSDNYYELLGVSFDSNQKEIKEAYRKLQKKYHPDIAGQKGHEYTIKLNEAYQVLMKDDMRREYDASASIKDGIGTKGFTGLGYSSWKGPLRPQALFVDENACIGCRECIHNARNTFMMDEAVGCARVKVQFGDDDNDIEVAVESCPVNCIHWVEREELPVLEFLIRPQPLDAHGMFGGGWGRPSNVFMATKFFIKQLKQKDNHNRSKSAQVEFEETAAQAEARTRATMKLQMEKFSRFFSWIKQISGIN